MFLINLRGVVVARRWACRAFCLMTTHYHLLLSTKDVDLGEGMQRLNGRYAQWFNARHARSGHLFEGRYRSVLVESQAHLLESYRYIALNPVSAGLCREPEDWLWSSYRIAVVEPLGPFALSDLVLDEFGRGAGAREKLRRFVRDGRAVEGHDPGQTP
jgi:REP element-mobilizing transposase RayT